MVFSIVVFLIVFAVVYLLFSKMFAGRYATTTDHTRHVLEQIREESRYSTAQKDHMDETLEILKADIKDSAALRFISYLPFGKRIVVKMVKAGRYDSAGSFVITTTLMMVVGLLIAAMFKPTPLTFLLAVLVPLWLANKSLTRRIQKRNNKFIDMFPDVLDMIVRSVKSGFPINTAISMIAENMEDPVKAEFKQMADELALGRPLNEALNRLATRVDEQDIRFFVVVLKIQQETGGSLAEVITNLSNIIRKRKQLRQKIRAMTSEGRATGYILGGIPVVIFCVLYFFSPGHLDPLFDTDAGNMLGAVVIALVVGAQMIVRKMVDIDI